MSLFDQVLGGIVGQFGSSQQKGSLMDLAAKVVKDHPGGLAGLVQQFQSGGLAEQAKSWVGTGLNQPISADQLKGVIGEDRMATLSKKLGISPEAASAGLAALLPVVIDHLTPKGKVEPGADHASALAALKAKLSA